MKPFRLYSIHERINARAAAAWVFEPSAALPTMMHVWRRNVQHQDWLESVGASYAAHYTKECLR